MNYTEFQSYIQTLAVDQAPSADFTTIFPAAIQDAEQRIYRELDFLATRTVQSPTNFVTSNRELSLPTTSNIIMVVQGVSAITPVGGTLTTGKQNILEPVSLDFIDSTWPDVTQTGLPDSWAMKDNAIIVVKPTPDANYNAAITGTFRPAPLSALNPNTYISDIYPDLMIAATMVFIAGAQRDYGAQSDDPKLAISWESHYQTLKQSALEEEQRRKGSGTGWSPFSQTQAMPPRS